jgi:MoaD family protein
MQITLKLLKPLKDIVGKDSLSIEVEEGTVASLFDRISKDYPELGKELFDEKGELDYRVNVIHNDRPLVEFDVEMSEGDSVTLFIPISGG